MRKTLIKIALWVLRRLKASPLEMDLGAGFWFRGNLYYVLMTTLESRDDIRELTIRAHTHKED